MGEEMRKKMEEMGDGVGHNGIKGIVTETET